MKSKAPNSLDLGLANKAAVACIPFKEIFPSVFGPLGNFATSLQNLYGRHLSFLEDGSFSRQASTALEIACQKLEPMSSLKYCLKKGVERKASPPSKVMIMELVRLIASLVAAEGLGPPSGNWD